MREHEAGRRGSPWRWHSWFKRIAQAVTQVSVVTLLRTGAESSLAARKNKSRGDDRGGGDQSAKDRDRGSDRDQNSKSKNGREEERKVERESNDKAGRDGDGDSRNNDRGRKQERQADESDNSSSAVAKEQKADQNNNDSGTTNVGQDTTGGNEDTTGGNEDSTTGGNEDTTGGGGGGNGGRGDGGRGDGGGNDAGNAGSGLFDSPLATKTRRRANDFDNANREDEDDGIIVDIDPDGESVYETDSILFASGPEGAEILTDNITFFAEPALPPEPLPRLELPVREPGYPFGEDFPFGDFPFGNTTVILDPAASEPTDPGDAAPAPVRRAEPIPAADQPAPANSDGGDNTMDFLS